MLARRFLWLVAAIIVLVVAAALAYRLFGRQLLAAALVPSTAFAADAAPPLDYARPAAWDANPALPDDPARWLPAGVAAARGPAAVFFVAPTAYIDRAHWNMPWDDAPTNARRALYLRMQASAFTAAGRVWAPKYREATFGAFLTARPEATRALDLAYGDVERAFAAFVAAVPAGTPIVLAGHSQGARHLLRLVADHVAGTPLAGRIVAVYAVGWPVDAADLARMRLPACASPAATGCLLTWRSYAEPAEPSDFRVVDPAGTAPAPLVCVDPLTGDASPAPASANRGALTLAAGDVPGGLIAGAAGAACRATYLSIGPPPAGFDRYLLPGNNYHVYDISLFWANVRADAARRVAAWALGHGAAGAHHAGTIGSEPPAAVAGGR